MDLKSLKNNYSLSGFFVLLFGVSGWLVSIVLAFYLISWFFTPAQLCGYYLENSFGFYTIKSYWRFGYDKTVYTSLNGKEAMEALQKLNEQPSPLTQQQRPKNI